MSSRTSSALVVALVAAGCSPPATQRQDARSSPDVPATAAAARQDADFRIGCARGGAALEPLCTVDRDGDGVLTVRFPDGGFRRLKATGDGRGVEAADGADPARVSVVDNACAVGDGKVDIDVAVGADRIRLPAHLSREGTGDRR